jgi:hypothetical protein
MTSVKAEGLKPETVLKRFGAATVVDAPRERIMQLKTLLGNKSAVIPAQAISLCFCLL